MKRLEVVAAILIYNNEILCAQRGTSKFEYVNFKYEFPGGKIEIGETKENALIRELWEELHLEITNPIFFMTNKHQYPDFEITMHSFKCQVDSKELVLTEHINAKWLPPENLGELNWAEADLPIVNALQNKILYPNC